METLTYSSGRASGCDSPGLLNFPLARVCQEVCVNGSSFPCAAGDSGRWKSGNPAFGFPLFHRLAGAVGMWESRLGRFPKAGGAEGNLLLVFLRVHDPAFPRPSSCASLPQKARE